VEYCIHTHDFNRHQFLNHMQMYLTVHAFREHCRLHLPHLAKCLEQLSPEQIAEALTAKSCAEDFSYEKLEWIGDGVLKMIQTDSLIYSSEFSRWIEFLHEGDLSTLRSEMGCNDRLSKACKRLKIDHFLLTAPLGRSQWCPATLELYSPTEKRSDTGEGPAVKETLPGKACAGELLSIGRMRELLCAFVKLTCDSLIIDVIESLLGLVYLNCGYENATLVADEMQISLIQMADRSKALPNRQLEPKIELVAVATTFTGHSSFKRKDLVQEAFTHPTAMHPETPSYQRLEWIGDAVLCLSAREWIFKTFPNFEVGQMVSIEASLVCNASLAFLAIKHKLLQYLDHCDQTLPSQIEHQLWCTEELGRGLWGTDPPKVCADVVESLIGAVYLDSGLASGMSAVSKILSPLYDCLEKIHSKDHTIDTMHPRKLLQEMGGSLLELIITREEEFAARQPQARIWLGRRWGTPRLDSQDFVASVECLGVDVVCVSDSSAEVAGNRAAAIAVAMLKRNPTLLSRVQSVRGVVESSSSKETKKADSEQKSESDTTLLPGLSGWASLLDDDDDPTLL
jgi:dsRNA-specific ribonuclease